MNVIWKSRSIVSQFSTLAIPVMTTAAVLLTFMVPGATAFFADSEQTISVNEQPAFKSDLQLDTTEDQSVSPKLSMTSAPGTGAVDTPGVPTSVNALEVSTSNDGFMLIVSLLLIAIGSTAITWGLASWIDPKKSDQMDKVHFE